MRVRVIRVPEGDAPLEIRKQWVGCELPVYKILRENSYGYGVLSGEPKLLSRGVVIRIDRAIPILAERSPEAAQWFIEHIPLSMHLCFQDHEVEVLE